MPLPGRQRPPVVTRTRATARPADRPALARRALGAVLVGRAHRGLAAGLPARVGPGRAVTGHVKAAPAQAKAAARRHGRAGLQRRLDEPRPLLLLRPAPDRHRPGHRDRRPAAGFAALAGPAGFHPTDLSAAYGLPSATGGAGQTVYIVDAYHYPNAEADLAIYRAQFGLPACTTANGCFRQVNQDGLTAPLPASNSGWAGEMALDLDMVSAICPDCHITLIEANDAGTNMLTAVGRANTMGAKFVSMSWGGTEQRSARRTSTRRTSSPPVSSTPRPPATTGTPAARSTPRRPTGSSRSGAPA